MSGRTIAFFKAYRDEHFRNVLCFSVVVDSLVRLVHGVDVEMIEIQLNSQEVIPSGDQSLSS